MILAAQANNSRERFNAISKGRQPPPKQGNVRIVPQLDEERREQMEDTFAAVLAKMYRKEF